MEKQVTDVTTYIDKVKGTYTVKIHILRGCNENRAFCFVKEANGASRSCTNITGNYKVHGVVNHLIEL